MVDSVGKDCVSLPPLNPVTWPILVDALMIISSCFPHVGGYALQGPTQLRTAFHLCAHVREVAKSSGSTHYIIQQENTIVKPTDILVKFLTFKHSKPNTAYSRVLKVDGSTLCPVNILRAYLLLWPHHNTGPPLIHSDGSVISSELMSEILWSSLHTAILLHMASHHTAYPFGRRRRLPNKVHLRLNLNY